MNTISATVVAHSISDAGKEICTLHVVMPRFILPQFNTHRAFARNTRSSRAVPTKVVIDEVMNNPVVPLRWGVNKPGMQAAAEMGADTRARALRLWLKARDEAVSAVMQMLDSPEPPHKQIVNRLLEPWMWAHTLVTATEWRNFFALRLHDDAQPEIQALAQAMRDAMDSSTPVFTPVGGWHRPYISGTWMDREDLRTANMVSAARCARVSYAPFDGSTDVLKEIARAEKLLMARPAHASPFEHIAFPYGDDEQGSGPFRGWGQWRALLPDNVVRG